MDTPIPLMRLEERIVLNAAGLVDDGTAEIADPLRALVIDGAADPTGDLARAAADNVIAVTYERDSDTPESILQALAEHSGGQSYASLAWASHEPGASSGEPVPLTLESLPEMEAFWDGVAAMIAPDGQIDLLACDLASTPEGIAFAEALADMTGLEVNASEDATGNPEAGGDWDLEHGQEQADALYFDADGLDAYSHLLAAPYDISLSPTTAVVSSSLLGSGGAGDDFGLTVAMDGDFLFVGEPGIGVGKIYVYEWDGSAWNELSTDIDLDVSGEPPAELERVGIAIDYSDGILLFAEDDLGPGGDDIGRVWFYSSNFTDRFMFIDPHGPTRVGAQFGRGLAIDGGWAAIGAPGDTGGSGRICFFEQVGANLWVDSTHVFGAAGEGLGASVSMDNGWTLVGSPNHDGGEGAVHLYEFGGGTWSDAGILDHAVAGASFGQSIAVSDSFALVGAPGEGAAYLYENTGGVWSQAQVFSGSAADQFGASVSISGSKLVIGAPGSDAGGTDSGAIYVYENSGSSWTQSNVLTGDAGAKLGASSAVGPQAVVAGAPSAGNTGAVQAYSLNASVDENSLGGTQIGTLSAIDPDGDPLTFSLVGGDTAPFEILGNQLLVKSGADLDYESQASYTITIRASDGGASIDESFTIQINDIGEAPVVTPQPPLVELPPPDDSGLPPEDGIPVEEPLPGEDLAPPVEDGGDLSGVDLSDLGRVDPGRAVVEEPEAGEKPVEEEGPLFADLRDLNESSLLELAFDETLLFAPDQPVELQEAFSTILKAYSASSEELAAYLQSAFRSVAESSALHRQSDTVLRLSRLEMARSVQAGYGIEEEWTPLFKEVLEARVGVLTAATELKTAIADAAAAGKGGFDKVLEDVVVATVLGLNRANDQLTAETRALKEVAQAQADRRVEKAKPLSDEALKRDVTSIREAAFKETEALRRRWDMASEDVFSAFIKRLVREQPQD